ncbi:esterase [Arthrobacter livingstonensis]|uniref:Esterase n=1 Tax=Arthrobacter livingstonensis TaxID=670078 RepID=A0A2V5L957_9MICC|nr:alpha/beta fold hydrolase [Arthrobacter livingstonensis]PYI67282.1 esterase [Arthrobacter livingstonensis]
MRAPGTTRRDHITEVIPFTADDGLPLTLVHVGNPLLGTPPRGPVLLVHGAGVRAELFRPPLPRTLVDALLDDGWDVWMLNWRASIDLQPVPWTLDDAAAYDHPAAVRYVLAETGAESLAAFIHCQGSTSFTMAAVAGLLPGVRTIVSNAVSLHVNIPAFSKAKITRMLPLVGAFTPSLSPRWGYKSYGYFSRVVRATVRATHWECHNTVCRMVSFTYGSGRPALWSHENLDDATHRWITGEFAGAPLTFFRQMADCARAGYLVPARHLALLPQSFVAQAPQTDARFVFLAGEDNRCFLPEGQQRSFDFFAGHRPGRDAVHLLPGYGHLDVIFGKNAWRDTYPLIVKELGS